MRRSVLWVLVYGASVLGVYAWGGLRGAWRMRFPTGGSAYGGGSGYGGGGGFRGGK